MTSPLPRLLLLTDRRQCARPLLEVLALAVDGGARAIVLREKDLPGAERDELAAATRDLLAPTAGLLVVAGLALQADARHLSAVDPLPGVRPRLLGRSCHDADEVAAASRERCDWVTLSPVYATASKPGYGPALGACGLARLPAGPPVYALGGVTVDRVPECLAAGAYGVAVMGEVMRAPDPAAAVGALLDRLPA